MRRITSPLNTVLLITTVILVVIVFLGLIFSGSGAANWNGLSVEDLSAKNINNYNLHEFDSGVVVVEVNGVAERIGIQEGDVVTQINQRPVDNMDSYLSAARFAEEDRSTVIQVQRSGYPIRFHLSGSGAPYSDYTQQASFGLGPTNPLFLVGGTNTAMNQNIANRSAQTKPIPSEGVWLGVEIEQITPETISEQSLPADQTGVIVDSVPIGSAVEKAGLKNGDIIVAINGQSIVNMADYIRVTNNQEIKAADISIDRNGKELFLSISPAGENVVNTYNNSSMGNPSWGTGRSNLYNRPSGPGQINAVGAPSITINSVLPHGYRGVCANCHQIVDSMTPVAQRFSSQTGNNVQSSSGPPSPSQQNAAGKVLVEGHWLGMELIPITPELAREYNLPERVAGLLVDEVTLEAAESGLLAGDVLQSINNYPVKTLKDFNQATRKVEAFKEATLGVLRNGQRQLIRLHSSWYKLGVAQNEAAQPIRPGALSPHKVMDRACTACHIIMESGGQLPTDAGDILPTPPPITSFAKAPHTLRGSCNVCHVITK